MDSIEMSSILIQDSSEGFSHPNKQILSGFIFNFILNLIYIIFCLTPLFSMFRLPFTSLKTAQCIACSILMQWQMLGWGGGGSKVRASLLFWLGLLIAQKYKSLSTPLCTSKSLICDCNGTLLCRNSRFSR